MGAALDDYWDLGGGDDALSLASLKNFSLLAKLWSRESGMLYYFYHQNFLRARKSAVAY